MDSGLALPRAPERQRNYFCWIGAEVFSAGAGGSAGVAPAFWASASGRAGCGESGAIGGPPCITNGVMDALSELGIKQLNTPLTPAKIWQAIRDAKAGVA